MRTEHVSKEQDITLKKKEQTDLEVNQTTFINEKYND